MQPWLDETHIGLYLREQRSSLSSRTPIIPSVPGIGRQSFDEHLDDLRHLDEAIPRLEQVQQSVANDEEAVTRIRELIQFIQELKRDFPVPVPEQAFERLQILRSWLFWLPPALLREDEVDLGSIAVLSHFFTIGLLIDRLFPEIGGSYFGTMAAMPIDQMRTTLLTRQAANPQETGIQMALSLTEYPARVVMAYKQRQQSLMQHHDQYQVAAPQPFSPSAHILRSSYISSESNPTVYPEDVFGGPAPADLQFSTHPSYPQGGPGDTISGALPADIRFPAPSPYMHSAAALSPETSYASQSTPLSPSPIFDPSQLALASPMMGTTSSTTSPERRFRQMDQYWSSPELTLGEIESPEPVFAISITSINPTELLWT